MRKIIKSLIEGYRLAQESQESKSSDKHGKCCICGKDYSGYGNNPWPLQDEGGCCDRCNFFRVVPARLGIKLTEDEIDSLPV